MATQINYPNQHAWQQVNASMQECPCGAAYGYKITENGKQEVALRLWEKCTKGVA